MQKFQVRIPNIRDAESQNLLSPHRTLVPNPEVN